MEPAEAAMKYVIRTTVKSISEEFDTIVVEDRNSAGEKIWRREQKSKGFFVLFEGSHEKLYLGRSEPEFLYKGSHVKITIETESSTQCLPLISTKATTTPSSS